MMRSRLLTASAAAALLLMSGTRLLAQSPASEIKPLPPIEVEAQRRSVEKRVNAFIAAITPHVYADSLARWQHGICPVVIGPPQAQIDQILARLSAISTAAGVPVQPKPCNANFYVVATTYPEKLLKTWSKRDRLLFGNAMPKLVDEFLDTPRAVRVWYNTIPADKPVDDGVNPEPFGGLMTPISPGAGVNAGTIADAAANTRSLEFNEVQRFTSVIVVVDTQRTAGIKLASLSDYIAMVGLSKINLDANFTGAPSILQLFVAASGNSNEATPTSITSWDQDYLHGLYATRQSSRLQRAAIADMMVRDIAH
jgi:hypothetical protein